MVTSAARAASPARALGVGGAATLRVPVLPVVGVAVAWISTVIGLVVLSVADVWSLPVLDNVPVDATVGFAFPLVGAGILLGSRSEERHVQHVARVLLGSGAASGGTVLTTALTATATASSPGVDVALVLQSWLWVPAVVPLLTVLPLLYPDGLLPGRRWRAALWASAAATVLLAAGVAVFPEDVVGRVRLTKPATSAVLAPILTVPGAVLLVASTLAALVSLVLRLRRADGLQRRQVVVFFAAAALVVADLTVQPVLPSVAGEVTQASAFALLPLALGVAITRDRLYELDLAVARALVALSLAGCLAGTYLTLFALLRGLGPGSAWSGALAAGVTGFLLQPLGARLSRGVDRLFYGDRADPFAVTRRLSSRLRVDTDALAVPQVVCDTIVDALRFRAATLAVTVDDTDTDTDTDTDPDTDTAEEDAVPLRPVASAGGPTEGTEGFDLRHRGVLLGRLLIAPRAGESALAGRDRELLEVLADQIAPALSAVRLSEALQRSREYLVAAREEERRRLRRDLHDGLGAALAGVRLQLESAREIVPDPRAGRLLDAATAGVAEAVSDVRRVTEDLRPPALDDLGLFGALVALAARFDSPQVPVHCTFGSGDESGVTQVSAAAEVACFRIASEALANAVRHAGAGHIGLAVAETGSALVLTVTDDGAAPRTSRPGGLGMSSMRTRAEEIGGRCTVEAGPAGTTVRAVLPNGSR